LIGRITLGLAKRCSRSEVRRLAAAEAERTAKAKAEQREADDRAWLEQIRSTRLGVSPYAPGVPGD
jgi:hypothetical protein